MTARLTVVFDDEELYRRTKIRAAEEGVSLKRIVEEALTAYIDGVPAGTERWTTGADVLAWMEEMKALDEDPDGPTDLSDIKHYLYGYPKKAERAKQSQRYSAEAGRHSSMQRVAEERAPYDPTEAP